jgi:hypothetical protein
MARYGCDNIISDLLRRRAELLSEKFVTLDYKDSDDRSLIYDMLKGVGKSFAPRKPECFAVSQRQSSHLV